MNKHGNHDASCLCCVHIHIADATQYGCDSCDSPGAFKCDEGHWTWEDAAYEPHIVFTKARLCKDFEPRGMSQREKAGDRGHED